MVSCTITSESDHNANSFEIGRLELIEQRQGPANSNQGFHQRRCSTALGKKISLVSKHDDPSTQYKRMAFHSEEASETVFLFGCIPDHCAMVGFVLLPHLMGACAWSFHQLHNSKSVSAQTDRDREWTDAWNDEIKEKLLKSQTEKQDTYTRI